MGLSVLVALVLTPALCASLLKPAHELDLRTWHGRSFHWFNRSFNRGNQRSQSFARRLIARSKHSLLGYGLLTALMVGLFSQLPSAFLPDEDQGILFNQIVLPAGSTTEQTLGVVKKVEDFYLSQPDSIQSVFSVTGFSFAGNGQNMALGFVNLKHWDERRRPEQHVGAIAGKAMGYFASIKEAFVFAFPPPAVLELGTANGFNLYLQ